MFQGFIDALNDIGTPACSVLQAKSHLVITLVPRICRSGSCKTVPIFWDMRERCHRPFLATLTANPP